MRNAAIIGGYALAILAIIGTGVAAIGNVTERSVKEERELDAAIDRILAQQRERRALLQAAKTNPSTSVKGYAASAPQASPRETLGMAAQAEALPPDDKKPEGARVTERNKQLARVHPNARRRQQGRNTSVHFLPAAFAQIPKFTVHTLLGFR